MCKCGQARTSFLVGPMLHTFHGPLSLPHLLSCLLPPLLYLLLPFPPPPFPCPPLEASRPPKYSNTVRAQSTLGIHFLRIFSLKHMYDKLTKCPKFTQYLPEKYFPEFLGKCPIPHLIRLSFWLSLLPVFLYSVHDILYVLYRVCIAMLEEFNKKAQLTQGLRATAVRVWRPYGKNLSWAGNPTNRTKHHVDRQTGCEVMAILYIQDGRQPPSWIYEIL